MSTDTERDMAPVIERLRKSKLANDEIVFDEGKEAGKEWAEQYAEAAELERLQRHRDRFSTEPTYLCTEGDAAFTEGERLATVITGNKDLGRSEMSDFWEGALGDDEADRIHEDKFLQGFVEGALEVWGAVKDKI